MIHLIRAAEKKLYKDPRFFELTAIDFLLDDDLNLWFLENNFNPAILAVSDGRRKRHYKMHKDIFDM